MKMQLKATHVTQCNAPQATQLNSTRTMSCKACVPVQQNTILGQDKNAWKSTWRWVRFPCKTWKLVKLVKSSELFTALQTKFCGIFVILDRRILIYEISHIISQYLTFFLKTGHSVTDNSQARNSSAYKISLPKWHTTKYRGGVKLGPTILDRKP